MPRPSVRTLAVANFRIIAVSVSSVVVYKRAYCSGDHHSPGSSAVNRAAVRIRPGHFEAMREPLVSIRCCRLRSKESGAPYECPTQMTCDRYDERSSEQCDAVCERQTPR